MGIERGIPHPAWESLTEPIVFKATRGSEELHVQVAHVAETANPAVVHVVLEVRLGPDQQHPTDQR